MLEWRPQLEYPRGSAETITPRHRSDALQVTARGFAHEVLTTQNRDPEGNVSPTEIDQLNEDRIITCPTPIAKTVAKEASVLNIDCLGQRAEILDAA